MSDQRDNTSEGNRASGHAGGAPRLSELAPAITIHAQMSQTRGVTVNGIELLFDDTRIRLTFEADRNVADVFGREMAEFVTGLCHEAPENGKMLSLPDLKASISGCELEGAAILARAYAENVAAITIRLRRLQGNALALLQPGVLRDDATSRALERAVDEAIERIYVPLRNFETSIDLALREGRRGEAERIHAQIIAFRTEIDNICYNFERLLADDLARRDAARPALPPVEDVEEESGSEQSPGGPPYLRLIPGNR
ncbi:hypothetical protein [Pontivivens ytuae]|uniref:Uncharacterized protein n=1 Tax=Pontivivens ytuae TaxID=2789856 RepID=A0A7S9QCJ2_9RHOB|nr:hypothetical protein [Pontivivens ytuae]QPH53870.1 hypothetical protein I0K15_19175 [Pontivivens ytuae]